MGGLSERVLNRLGRWSRPVAASSPGGSSLRTWALVLRLPFEEAVAPALDRDQPRVGQRSRCPDRTRERRGQVVAEVHQQQWCARRPVRGSGRERASSTPHRESRCRPTWVRHTARSSHWHWTFLSNHGQVLLCIAHGLGVRLQEIGDQVGITERAAPRIVAELVDAGYLVRERRGDARGRRARPLSRPGCGETRRGSYAAGR